jgi:hypothetical protein
MEPTTDAESSGEVAQQAGKSVAATPEMQLPIVMLLVLALISGAIFFFVAQVVLPIFECPEELRVPMPPPEIAVAREKAMSLARMQNASVAGGLLGLLLGLLLGVGEAAARRAGSSAFTRVGVGAVLATVLGGLGGLLGQLVIEQLMYAEAVVPITRTTVAEIVGLGLLGLGVGLAVGLVAASGRTVASYAAGGAVAGVLAGALFPTACAVLFHRVKTDGILIPGGVLGGRVELAGLALWTLMIVLCIALLLPFAGRQRNSGTAAKQPEKT